MIFETFRQAIQNVWSNKDVYKRQEENKAEDSTIDADIAIVGAGGAGMTAAITAAAEGKNCLLYTSLKNTLLRKSSPAGAPAGLLF